MCVIDWQWLFFRERVHWTENVRVVDMEKLVLVRLFGWGLVLALVLYYVLAVLGGVK